jgi:FkbM family methyltransferase
VPAYRLRNVGLQEWPITAMADVPGVGRIECHTADVIQRYLYLFHVWEPTISALLRAHLRPGDVVVDVGANIGYYTLMAAQAVGDTGHVVAFEPSPTVRAQLVGNIERNHLADRITVHGVAAGSEPGRLTIFLAPQGNLGQTSTRPSEGFAAEAEVDVRRVDDCVPAGLRPRVRFLKVDTEGDELAAVLGARGLLAEMPDGAMVLIEVDQPRMRERGADAGEIFALMSELGYQAHTIANDYEVAAYVRPAEPILRPADGVVPEGDVVFVRMGQMPGGQD